MADVLSANVRSLHETLRSKSPHRAERAAQLATDLYQLCVESVSDTEKGMFPALCRIARSSPFCLCDICSFVFFRSVLFICAF
jgi:hypothetical protein